jgi:hypothetical protein
LNCLGGKAARKTQEQDRRYQIFHDCSVCALRGSNTHMRLPKKRKTTNDTNDTNDTKKKEEKNEIAEQKFVFFVWFVVKILRT